MVGPARDPYIISARIVLSLICRAPLEGLEMGGVSGWCRVVATAAQTGFQCFRTSRLQPTTEWSCELRVHQREVCRAHQAAVLS